jgi:hypothetical protein
VSGGGIEFGMAQRELNGCVEELVHASWAFG